MGWHKCSFRARPLDGATEMVVSLETGSQNLTGVYYLHYSDAKASSNKFPV